LLLGDGDGDGSDVEDSDDDGTYGYTGKGHGDDDDFFLGNGDEGDDNEDDNDDGIGNRNQAGTDESDNDEDLENDHQTAQRKDQKTDRHRRKGDPIADKGVMTYTFIPSADEKESKKLEDVSVTNTHHIRNKFTTIIQIWSHWE
jgi:hypothetical protein